MQVVYSGGTSTPTPSPRVQRKFGYSRPTMPGYNTHVHPQVFVHRSGEKLTEGDVTLRDSIPLMSKSVAILCLILNIFLPGSGTMTAGLSVLCCSKVRPRGGTKRHCIWMNTGVALIQFFLTFLFLLGWIWSITWGVAFLTISRKHDRRQSNGHRHNDGDKIYDTSKSSHADSHHGSPHSISGKHSKHNHHHHTDQHRHHQQDRHRSSDAEYHHNNNRNHKQKYDINKSRTPSPRESPGITRNENSWLTFNTSAQTLTPNTDSTTALPKLNGDDCSATVPHQPIIVLQKAPELNHSEAVDDARKSLPNDAIMQARTRHMKMLQRKLSDNELSPFNLTNKQLEAIVIHDLPLVSPNGMRNTQISEEPEGLPKMEMS